MFPDKVKVEFHAAPTDCGSAGALSRATLFTTDPLKADRGLVRQALRRDRDESRQRDAITNVPGWTSAFARPTHCRPPPRGSRSITLVSKVRGLEAFCKKLEAGGVAFDAPFRDVPRIGLKIAFVLDPAGTRIQLTDGLAGR